LIFAISSEIIGGSVSCGCFQAIRLLYSSSDTALLRSSSLLAMSEKRPIRSGG
jgi:hypothetical protein